MRRAAALLVAALALAGCAGGHTAQTTRDEVVEGPLGRDGYQVWIFRPHEYPRAVVIFLHGDLDVTETTPRYHRGWIDHLVARRDAVVYPRYELRPGTPNVLQNLLIGAGIGLRKLGVRNVPIVVVGYSRGGRLAFDYAALAKEIHGRPDGILAVFPAARAPTEPPVDYAGVAHATRVRILVGDRDRVVRQLGARQAIGLLRRAGFPAGHIEYLLVRSVKGLSATHASVFSDSPEAQKAYWAQADDLIRSVGAR